METKNVFSEKDVDTVKVAAVFVAAAVVYAAAISIALQHPGKTLLAGAGYYLFDRYKKKQKVEQEQS